MTARKLVTVWLALIAGSWLTVGGAVALAAIV
jgi:hypothetical protein